MTFLGAGRLSDISAQDFSLQADTLNEARLPAQWDLQSCIDYALEQNITIRKNRVTAESTQIDVKTAKAALFPSLSFSTSQQVVNRPYQETSSRVSGSEIISSNSKTSYNGNYGLNASWTIYNGSKRLKTLKQERLNNQVAELDVATSENTIKESIAQIYIQILYAAESVRVNENTLQVSIAQRDRGQELLNAGSIAKSDFAQLEAQVSTDRYQLVTAQATLQDYKLQLKQLLELDGENEMNVYLPNLSDENVLAPLPAKKDVYVSALAIRPEIEASKLNALGITPIDDSTLKKDSYPDFYGTTYSSSGFWLTPPDNIEIWNNPKNSDRNISVKITEGANIKTSGSMYFTDHLKEDDKYPVFIDGNHALTEITNTNAKNGTILLIKDSFSHSLAPFLAENYSKVVLVDLRYYKESVSDLVTTYNPEQVVVLYGIDNLATDTDIVWLK